MRLSRSFTRTLKNAPADETAVNAQLLIRGGFVQKIMAGV
jgi:prolyl-tRNA synthetase